MAKVKACAECGEPFVAVHHQQKFCSQECHHLAQTKSGARAIEKQFLEKARRERQARRERLRRLAEQNRETAKITVEEREFHDSERGMVIRRVENRGTVPIGFGAARNIIHT